MAGRHDIGDEVSWMTIHGPKTGTIEEVMEDGYCLIRLPDKKQVLIHENGFRNGT